MSLLIPWHVCCKCQVWPGCPASVLWHGEAGVLGSGDTDSCRMSFSPTLLSDPVFSPCTPSQENPISSPPALPPLQTVAHALHLPSPHSYSMIPAYDDIEGFELLSDGFAQFENDNGIALIPIFSPHLPLIPKLSASLSLLGRSHCMDISWCASGHLGSFCLSGVLFRCPNCSAHLGKGTYRRPPPFPYRT